jgi:Zn-dependent protease with chaperone function
VKKWLLTLLLLLTVGQFKEIDKLLGQINKILPLAISDQQIGVMFSDGVAKQFGLDSNPERNARVQTIGTRIVAQNSFRSKYDFAVLASHDFNACSIYGGHIRVNEGLLSDTQNNEAEAAFAIAHELAHNELGHNKEAVKNFKITYALELTKLNQKLPQLINLAAKAVLAKRSRQNETAADAKALEYMTKAGFNSNGAISIARRIEAEHKIALRNAGGQGLIQQRFNTIFDTHPEPAKRAEMAENFYFQSKYGTAFNQVAGESDENTNSSSSALFGDRPIVVAHPSLWVPKLKDRSRVCAVGIFNPFGSEMEDVGFYLDVCRSGNLVAVTADNDSHDRRTGNGEGTVNRFTYIASDSADAKSLVSALKAGNTYASHDDTELKDMNFEIGRNYPDAPSAHFSFRLSAGNPKITLYRDGKDLGTFSGKKGSYVIDDPDASQGRRWYVLYAKEKFITSPITINITGDRRDESSPQETWQKGIIHYHSFYSDGKTKSIQQIWDAAQDFDVKFIFMTDHADLFNDKTEYQRYFDDCKRASSTSMIPGVEYTIGIKALMNHLLVLNLAPDGFKQYKKTSEDEFFNGSADDTTQVCIIKDQFHIGDDVSMSEMIKDATFKFSPVPATLKMWIKGSPFKDPIIWINRHEVGRVITTDDKWHLFTFDVPAEYLTSGRNLYHMESFIPDRQHTFDDCEVKDIWLVKK